MVVGKMAPCWSLKSKAGTSEASPQTDEACVAYFDGDTPPALGRLVKRFDQQIQRLWEGHQLAA